MSSLPWGMGHGQSPLFPSPIPTFCPPQRAQASPGAQDPLWGWRHHGAAHLDINRGNQAFLAQKPLQHVSQTGLGRKGGLGTRLGALGCTGRQGKAMGPLGKVPLGKNGVQEFVWWCPGSSGGPGEGAHLGAWLCTGASWGVLGCNGMDGNAVGALGKGTSLGRQWGAGVFSGVHWGVLGHTGMPWSVVAMEGRVWGQQNSWYPPQCSSLARL